MKNSIINSKNMPLVCGIALSIGCAWAQPAQGDIITSTNMVTADSSIRSGAPTSNGGFYNNNTILLGFSDTPTFQTMRVLVRSTITGIPDDMVIVSAALRLYSDLASGYNDTASIYRMTTDWSETTSLTWTVNGAGTDWAALGMLAGTDYLATPTYTTNMPSSTGFVEFDVTADVQAWYAGANDYGWAILNHNESTSSGLIRFRTREEATNPEQRPYLVVSYTAIPEPSTGLLLGMGAGFMFWIRRRMRHGSLIAA